MEVKQLISIELAEDVQNLIKFNKDVEIDAKLKEDIESFDSCELIKLTKEIGSLKIKGAEIVDDELLEREL